MSASVTRLTLISHGMTEAMRAARFPADEPLAELPSGAASPAAPRADRVLVAPELRATTTATLLSLHATIEPALRDLDCGDWAGRPMDTLDPADLMAWMTDPGYRGHGGEAMTDLLDRVRGWLESVVADRRRIVAITHPAVVRASVLLALAAPPESFWRLDVPPLSATTLHGRGAAWTVRHTANPL
ncbi:histidine phosphatase family protein [Nocardia africana]|uniref:Bifunctional RNase H/acid phosphatase n=1 Tax=Nocardia africana TaxID=134964 RepID=A0A378X010_9NOCA|nr:histidine phosphatase family protein [Nocardia africana]MCC3312670.1 histidine phosphatase family protein [Nocardia africana]SUA46004.1 bifunctional RNase H/acid phosphatase [Nocardia africana]